MIKKKKSSSLSLGRAKIHNSDHSEVPSQEGPDCFVSHERRQLTVFSFLLNPIAFVPHFTLCSPQNNLSFWKILDRQKEAALHIAQSSTVEDVAKAKYIDGFKQGLDKYMEDKAIDD